MLSKTLRDALNEQIKNEFFSGYIYLSCAAYFENANLPGFAHWMRQQNAEEQAHAMKFYNYILNRGSKVVLQAIPQPPIDFASPLDIFQQSLEHERQVTGMINRL
ncbi:MAG: ferritin, partial [Chloroflexi bacterium]|nr:ferritin [Chloroflexota bacterium]